MNHILNVFNGSSILSNIDLHGAYNLHRIKEGGKHWTAFRIKYGNFEYLVMPFGQTNAPASFQKLVNDIFQDLLDVYVVPRDGPSKSPAESQLASSKKPQGSSIIPWLCKFLLPFHHELFKEDQLTHQFPQERFLFPPQLGSSQSDSPTQRCFHHHSNPSLPTIVETYASNYALGAGLSQVSDSGKHPIAFDSHKHIPAGLYYESHDKELLGIVWALKCWRAFLLSLSSPFEILKDH
ncbi:hypothetical protein O181_080499, partial [Austropuccinia psidii MF-1]|nr:hypothetical protein [Austropuccinia psidii MF-1]